MSRDTSAGTPKKCRQMLLTPKSTRKAMKGDGTLNIHATDFVPVTTLELNEEMLNKTHHVLNRVSIKYCIKFEKPKKIIPMLCALSDIFEKLYFFIAKS